MQFFSGFPTLLQLFPLKIFQTLSAVSSTSHFKEGVPIEAEFSARSFLFGVRQLG